MIHVQDLNTLRAPNALVYPGSLETRAYKDWPVLTQALCFGLMLFGTMQPYPKPHIPHIFFIYLFYPLIFYQF